MSHISQVLRVLELPGGNIPNRNGAKSVFRLQCRRVSQCYRGNHGKCMPGLPCRLVLRNTGNENALSFEFVLSRRCPAARSLHFATMPRPANAWNILLLSLHHSLEFFGFSGLLLGPTSRLQAFYKYLQQYVSESCCIWYVLPLRERRIECTSVAM